jgi:predicted O-linked N-acetylglucosamine transferase (SPINDLY family)
LPSGGFVFCCFNSPYKILPDVFDTWMRILAKVPNGVLWFTQSNESVIANLHHEAKRRGVDAQRLIFAEHMHSLPDHLARHALGDLLLDTRPYNAHATAMDALWARLPVLTLIGDSFASRVAASLLRTFGLPELITETPEQYEALAVELAMNPARLATIRRTLVKLSVETPLFEAPSFTRHLESAYVAVHQRHRLGLGADHISVDPESR